VLQRHEVFAGLELVEDFLLFLKLFVSIAGSLDGQTDPAFALVDLDNTRVHVLAHLEHVLNLVNVILGDLRDVDEAINLVL